jgi:hypothetical protein
MAVVIKYVISLRELFPEDQFLYQMDMMNYAQLNNKKIKSILQQLAIDQKQTFLNYEDTLLKNLDVLLELEIKPKVLKLDKNTKI